MISNIFGKVSKYVLSDKHVAVLRFTGSIGQQS